MINKLTILKKLILFTLMALFVISFGSLAMAETEYIIRPSGIWTFEAQCIDAGAPTQIGIGPTAVGAANIDFYNEVGNMSPLDYKNVNPEYFPNLYLGFLYNGKLISQMTLGSLTGEYTSNQICIDSYANPLINEVEANKNDGLREYLNALKDDPNTQLDVRVIPFMYMDSTTSYGVEDPTNGNPTEADYNNYGKKVRMQNPSSGTWLKVLTGFDEAERELGRVNMLDGTSGDLTRQDLYGDLESNSNFFQPLYDALANSIFSLANLLFNIVQDGLKDAGNNTGKLITIDDIVFDKYDGISIDFWNNGNGSTIISAFKDGINTWFIRFRGFAIAGYLITLLYVGVRILIATGGKQEEKYKGMLTSWGIGIIILFFFPIVIKYSILLNHAIVTEIGKGKARSLTGTVNYSYPTSIEDSKTAQLTAQAVTESPFSSSDASVDYMAAMAESYKNDSAKSPVKAFVYFVMVFQFILLLITYYKRLFMTSFLIVIFPFVAFTYVLDKVGDGSAQGFQTWTKELILNVFMQCFHAIVYIFVLAVVFEGTTYSNDWILTIVGITFLFRGEEILRSLLGQTGGETAKSVRETATKVATSIAVTKAVADRITGNFSHVTGAIRAERQARADLRTARSMRGDFGDSKVDNMIREYRKGRDTESGETRRSFAKRILGARNIHQTGQTWAQTIMPVATGGVNISLPTPPTTTEGREMLNAARIVSDPIGEKATPEQLADAYEVIKKYDRSTNPEVMEIRARLGLSDEQLRMIAEAQANAARKLLSVDTTDTEKYNKTLTEVNKYLEIRMSKALTGSQNYRHSRQVIMWKRAILTNVIDVSTAQIRSGLSKGKGNTYLGAGSRALDKVMKASKQTDDFVETAKSLQEFVDLDDREKIARGGMFAPRVVRKSSHPGTNRTITTSRVQQEKRRLAKMFEPKESKRARMSASPYTPSGMLDRSGRNVAIYQNIFKDTSDKYRDEIAEHIAVLKDFGSRTHLTYDEQIRNEETLGYTAEEILERASKLKELAQDNESIETILKQEIGFDSNQIEAIVENLVMISYPDGAEATAVDEYITPSEAMEVMSASVSRDIERINGNKLQKQMAANRRTATVRTIRRKIVERKEKNIIYTIRDVGVDERTNAPVGAPNGTLYTESIGMNRGEQTRVGVYTNSTPTESRAPSARGTSTSTTSSSSRTITPSTIENLSSSSERASSTSRRVDPRRINIDSTTTSGTTTVGGGIRTPRESSAGGLGVGETSRVDSGTAPTPGETRIDRIVLNGSEPTPAETTLRDLDATLNSTPADGTTPTPRATERRESTSSRFDPSRAATPEESTSTTSSFKPKTRKISSALTDDFSSTPTSFESVPGSSSETENTRVNITPDSLSSNGSGATTVTEKNMLINHRHYRADDGKDIGIDKLFDLHAEHDDLNYGEVDIEGTKSAVYAEIVGQLRAGDNREKIAGVTKDLLQGTQEVDDNLMSERLFNMTAKEYEDRARGSRKEVIQEALKLTGTTVGGITLGTAGGFLNIGMSSSDSMLNEFGAGFAGGAAIAGVSSQIAFEGVGERKIKVYNPYDGSYTDVKIKRDGTFLDGQIAPMSLKEGEIVNLTDPRLAKVRTKVAKILVDAAAKNREELQKKVAQNKANKFEAALNYRTTSKK